MLGLARNGITNFGMDFLREAFCENSNSALKELDLSNNLLGHQGSEKLALYLGHKNCDLQKLNVSECGINGKGAISLFKGLKKCYTLQELKATKSDFSAKLVRRSVNIGLS